MHSPLICSNTRKTKTTFNNFLLTSFPSRRRKYFYFYCCSYEGEKVIVVIGGDDNYKNESEEEQSVISRWAWKEIARSQFGEESIDGRKSFVFSWNKKHRAIHEGALLHYFDPSKKGQKFEYQPRKMDLPPNPVVACEVVIANDERTSRETKREHPLSRVNVEQEEKLSGLSLDGLSSIVSKEKALTHHTAEGARAQAQVSLVIKEDRKPEGEVKRQLSCVTWISMYERILRFGQKLYLRVY